VAPPRIDYTARDFDSVMVALRAHLQAKFPDTWRNFYESSIGMAWLELVAYTHDILSFYLDFSANECLTGDTVIPLVDGTEALIKDLVGRDPFWVYSHDHSSGKIVPGRCTGVSKTRLNAELVEVILDNNQSVRCTPDHLWMLRDGTYREAKDLTPGTSLMPLYRWYDRWGYELLYQPDIKKLVRTHLCFALGVPLEVVHHKRQPDGGFNTRDNRPEVLEWMTWCGHRELHSTPKTADHRRRISEGLQRYWLRVKSGEISGPTVTPEWRYGAGSAFRGKKRPQHAAWMGGNQFARGYHHTEDTKRHVSSLLTGVPKPEGFGAQVSEALTGRAKSFEHRCRISAALLGRKQTHESNLKRSETLKRTWSNQYACANNHRVKVVRSLVEREDCYDLRVEQHHNFGLRSGVFVHNCFLPTARDRESVIRLGKLVGYQLGLPTGAAVVCAATIGAPQVVDVVIPVGTTVQTAKGVTFRVLAEQRISAGSLTGSATFTEGEARSESFVGSGATWLRLALTEPGVVSGSISVVVDGAVWSPLSSLVFATTTSPAYQVEHDENDKVYVLFGDGVNGQVPPAGSSIVVTYRVGGGVRGNINIGEVNTSIDGYLDGVLPPTSVSVGVVNDVFRGSGGEERETIEHAKLWIPRWATTNGRAVTERDFDTLATAFSSPVYGKVAFAKAKLKQEIPELNTVELYTWARDGGGNIVEPSVGLKDALQTYFMNNGEGAIRVVCTDVEVLNGVILYVDIDVTVTPESEYTSAVVVTNVTDSLVDLFDSAENEPGVSLRISKVYNAIQDSVGVSHAVVNLITASLKSTDAIGVGNAVTTHFIATLDLEPNLPVVPHTVVVFAGTQSLTDDGEGNLTGSGTGTIDYATGAVDVTFTAAPAVGQLVYATYRNVADYQRGEVETTSDGSTARFTGVVTYPPIVPWDPITSEKGIAFSDGIQVVTDDGNGALVGDVNPGGVNHIDYDTGAYDFTFAAVPGAGTVVRSTYRQMLRTPSEDIPVLKTQLVVRGNLTIGTA